MRKNTLIAASAATIALATMGAPPVSAQDRCVRIAMYESRGEEQSIDPAVFISGDDAAFVVSVFDPFIQLDNAFQPYGMLAESWEASDDAKVWTFRVRQGVKFHDGSELDAGDVVYTYRRLLDPATASGAAADLAFLKPEWFEAVDAATVRVTLENPNAELPLFMANKAAVIIPEGTTTETVRVHPVGTGPFMIEEFIPGAPKHVFARNPNYWQEGLPKAPCLEITSISEAMTRATAVMAGDIDLTPMTDPTTLVTLKDNPDVTLHSVGGGTLLTLSMFTETPPFDNLKVRQALKAVVDRQAIVDTVLLGYGEPGNDNPVPPSREDAFRHDPIPRDVEKAKRLLAEAGYADGLTVDLYTAEHFPGINQLTEAYKEMAAEAGITVNIINTPTDSYWEEIWLKKPFITSYWAARPAPTALGIAYRSTAPWNETQWHRADFDALLDKAGQTLDKDARTKSYQDAQRLLADEGGAIIVAFTNQTSTLRKECTGYQTHIDNNRMDFRNVVCQ